MCHLANWFIFVVIRYICPIWSHLPVLYKSKPNSKEFMRKIESEMNAAIRGRRNWSKANTSVVINDSNDALVYLHGNFIAKVSQYAVNLFDGGWQSVTTKSRLNAILNEFHYGSSVYQRNWNWFVNLQSGGTIPFYSGIELNH